MRLAFRALEVVAPAVSGRWAEHLWFRLPRPARSPRPLAGGVPLAVRVGAGTVSGMTWGTGPGVYLVHGWSGHAGQLVPFVAPLVERGFRVVAFDMPSHGASSPGASGPRSSSAVEFVSALTAVVAAQGPAYAVVAHSLGATATAVALCDGLAAERVVFLAPMASAAAYAHDLTVVLGAGRRTYRRLVRRIERRPGVALRHFEVTELGRAVAMPPTLVVHDRDDPSTDVADGEAIAAAWSESRSASDVNPPRGEGGRPPTGQGTRLHLTTGLGHRGILRDPDVNREVVDFVSG